MTHTNTPHRTWSRLAGITLAALVVAVMAGCLKVKMDLTIEGETVSGSIIAAFDRTAADALGMDTSDLFQSDEDDFSNLDGVTTTPYEDDDWRGVEYVFNQVALADLNELGGEDEDFPRIVYDAAAGTYEFTLTMDFTDFDSDDSTSDPVFPLDPAALMESFDVMVSVTFPGAVIEHNGELSGTTVTWIPEVGELNSMRALARASDPANDLAGGLGAGLPGFGSGGSPSTLVALLVGLGALVVMIAGGLIWWLARRRPSPGPVEAAPQPVAEPAAAASAAADDTTTTTGGDDS